MTRRSAFRILVLTDHRVHSPVESIYHMAQEMVQDERCACVHVVSAALPENEEFFRSPADIPLIASSVDKSFVYSAEGNFFREKTFLVAIHDYDVVLLRLPRSRSMDFFAQIGKLIPEERMLNQPTGIALTGDKQYLLNFPDICPPMRFCDTVEQVEAFSRKYPLVLKPLNSSGGKGIVRIEGEKVMVGSDSFSWKEYLPQLEADIGRGYLAMKFLRNVDQGDKRIIVANGKVVAASLRLPAKGAWLCNVSMGGTSEVAAPDPDELAIANRVVPDLLARGVVLFGFDTLVDDDGKRVLSELNTSCVNGIYPAQVHSGKPIVAETVSHLWDYILNNIRTKD